MRKRIQEPLTHAEIGRRGGMAGKGPAKARPAEVARAAAVVRWERHRASISMLANNSPLQIP